MSAEMWLIVRSPMPLPDYIRGSHGTISKGKVFLPPIQALSTGRVDKCNLLCRVEELLRCILPFWGFSTCYKDIGGAH